MVSTKCTSRPTLVMHFLPPLLWASGALWNWSGDAPNPAHRKATSLSRNNFNSVHCDSGRIFPTFILLNHPKSESWSRCFGIPESQKRRVHSYFSNIPYGYYEDRGKCIRKLKSQCTQ